MPAGIDGKDKARAMQKFNDLDDTLNFVYNPSTERGAGLSSSVNVSCVSESFCRTR